MPHSSNGPIQSHAEQSVRLKVFVRRATSQNLLDLPVSQVELKPPFQSRLSFRHSVLLKHRFQRTSNDYIDIHYRPLRVIDTHVSTSCVYGITLYGEYHVNHASHKYHRVFFNFAGCFFVLFLKTIEKEPIYLGWKLRELK